MLHHFYSKRTSLKYWIMVSKSLGYFQAISFASTLNTKNGLRFKQWTMSSLGPITNPSLIYAARIIRYSEMSKHRIRSIGISWSITFLLKIKMERRSWLLIIKRKWKRLGSRRIWIRLESIKLIILLIYCLLWVSIEMNMGIWSMMASLLLICVLIQTI